MQTAFSRTLRALNADGHGGSAIGILAVMILLGSWTAWCLMAHVTLREVTSNARLEVDRAVYPIQSPVAGRVAQSWLTVGRQVQAGDLLVELDTSAEHLQVGEERSRLAALGPQIEALRSQIASEQRARGAEQEATKVAAVAGGADYGPIDTAKGLVQEVEHDLSVAEADYKSLMERDVPPFNKMLLEKGITPLGR